MKTFTDHRCLVVLVLLLLAAPPADAAIYRWDNGELITYKDAVPGASFLRMVLGYADLSGANLFDASFRIAVLTNADLSGANLTNADFYAATLCSTEAWTMWAESTQKIPLLP